MRNASRALASRVKGMGHSSGATENNADNGSDIDAESLLHSMTCFWSELSAASLVDHICKVMLRVDDLNANLMPTAQNHRRP